MSLYFYSRIRASEKVRSAVTLVEVMVVSALILIAVLSLWQTYVNAFKVSLASRELTTAVDDARDVIERLKSTPFVDIANKFPAGTAVDLAFAGGQTLNNEMIVVDYINGTVGDILNITVTVSWTGADKHQRSEEFYIMRARGM